MLKRFQMTGQTLEVEVVTDRLLLLFPLDGAEHATVHAQACPKYT
jgi:hypothetical protein